eukprot:2783516-Pleurochrysis_carterae.AAC.1
MMKNEELADRAQGVTVLKEGRGKEKVVGTPVGLHKKTLGGERDRQGYHTSRAGDVLTCTSNEEGAIGLSAILVGVMIFFTGSQLRRMLLLSDGEHFGPLESPAACRQSHTARLRRGRRHGGAGTRRRCAAQAVEGLLLFMPHLEAATHIHMYFLEMFLPFSQYCCTAAATCRPGNLDATKLTFKNMNSIVHAAFSKGDLPPSFKKPATLKIGRAVTPKPTATQKKRKGKKSLLKIFDDDTDDADEANDNGGGGNCGDEEAD